MVEFDAVESAEMIYMAIRQFCELENQLQSVIFLVFLYKQFQLQDKKEYLEGAVPNSTL